ncbi:MAG TPA: hypothetical protein DEP87_03860 [Candidatus Pacebacteria bacterium]|nr:hypothetical protein [Candidatus Paceibacterota bacterium]
MINFGSLLLPQPAKALRPQAGQAGLIVILLGVVVLTVGLSLFVRTSRQVEIISQQEESARIFSAAETGIEKILADIMAVEQNQISFGSISSQQLNLDNNTAQVDLTVTQGNSLETYLEEGSTAEMTVSTTATVTINWSKVACDSNPAALIIAVHNTDPGSGAQTTRFEAVNGSGCPESVNFSTAAAGTSPYKFKYSLALIAGDTSVRIEPIFAGTDIKATGTSISSGQFTITSKAQDSSGASDQAKAIEVKRTIAAPPSFMDYTVYSGSSVTK